LQAVILPLLGGLILFAAMIKTGYDLTSTEDSETKIFGLGGAFVLGIGSVALGIVLMIVYNLVAPAYFRGETLRDDQVVTETGEFVPADEVAGVPPPRTASEAPDPATP
jgi:hypothetical protein